MLQHETVHFSSEVLRLYTIKVWVSTWLWVGMCEVGWKGTGDAREKEHTHTHYNPKAVQTPSKRECFNTLQQYASKSYHFKKFTKPREIKEVQKVSLQTHFQLLIFNTTQSCKRRDHKTSGQPFHQAYQREQLYCSTQYYHIEIAVLLQL